MNTTTTESSPQAASSPHSSLQRALRFPDLTLLLLVAVVNVNILPVICAEGWTALTLWILSFVLFLVPQGLAVVEFNKKYPVEGGIYFWTKQLFGEFHGFVSGWCYWTNNLFYIPSVLLILVGVAVYTGGEGGVALGENKNFMALSSIIALWIITAMHMRGLRIGKWLNNIGAAGIWFSLALLLAVGLILYFRKGGSATPFALSQLVPSLKNYGTLATFSLTIYSLVGLELGSVMGEEIEDPERNVPRAVFAGAVLSILLYMGGTAILLMAVSAVKIGAIDGLMQGAGIAFAEIGFSRLIPLVAILTALAVLGIGSAWLAGSARIPFVMGVRHYLPDSLGAIHPRWKTPHIALLVQGIVSTLLILLTLYGSTVKDAYLVLLSGSVVIQLIPFLYLFLGLWKLGKYRPAAVAGFITTLAGIAMTFMPTSSVDNVLLFQLKVAGGSFAVLAIGLVFYLKATFTQKNSPA